MSTEFIRIVFTVKDIHAIADAASVERSLAVKRAREWAEWIQESATGLCNDQLYDAIATGQP